MKSFPQDWAGGNWGWTKDTRLPGTAGLLGVGGGTRIWVQPQVPQQRLCPPAPTEQRIQGTHRKQEMGKELRGDTLGKGSLLCFPQAIVPKYTSHSHCQIGNSLSRIRPVGRLKSRHRSKSVRQKDLLLSKSVNFKLGARGTQLARQLLNCTAVSTRGKCWPGSSLGTSEGPAEGAVQSQRRRGGGGSDAEVLGAPSSQTHGLRSQLSPQTQQTTAERRTAAGAPSGLPAQSYLPGGGVSGANFSLLGTFLGLVAFLDGLGSGGRGSCSSSWAPAGSGGENGSGSGRA